ncbi:MAG TPA: hypothetical protein VH085_01735, partial [Nocardioides sp.]|nr:hypothetical protein [Nocardioides sp.]
MRTTSRTFVALGALTLTIGMGGTPSAEARQAATAPLHVNSCWPTDNGPVVLDSIAYSTSAVDVTDSAATVHVVVDAHDTGGPGPATGVASMTLATSLGRVPLRLSGGHWVGALRVPHGTEGTRVTGDLLATDDGGHTTDLDGNGPGGYVVDISDTTPDRTAPQLEDLRVARHHVDTTHRARRVHVTATVTDTGSGVASVVAGPDYPNARSAQLTRVPGTDRFRGALVVPRFVGDHSQRLTARVTDVVGNTKVWRAHEVRNAGFDALLQITSGDPDRQAPRLVRVMHATRHLDLRRHDGQEVVEVLLSDNRGVGKAWVLVQGFAGSHALHRVSGTARRGVWRATVRVGRCGNGPGTGHLALTVMDQSHQYTSAGLGPVHVRALDRRPFEAHWVVPPANALLFRFDEPVHGISASNVAVRDPQQATVAGTWSCRGASGSPVSCLRGA